MDTLHMSIFQSTAPNPSLMYSQLNKLTVNTNLDENEHYRCAHINTLVLEIPISSEILKEIIDIDQVEHLIISSLDDMLTFKSLTHKMSRLSKLTITNSVTMNTIERIRTYQFTQIRSLQISLSERNMDCIIEELFLLFPHIEYLMCKSPIPSVTMMIRMLNGFEKLLKGSFCADCSFYWRESNFCRYPNSINSHSQQYTCQVYHSPNTQIPLSIQWSIENQSLNHSFWRRGYRWYYLKYHALQKRLRLTIEDLPADLSTIY
ncbi:hypothetical protein I4U23_020102 [Adineta vaga]|nr:hypothetical protein I4U23_020102 [Adineta vaga]